MGFNGIWRNEERTKNAPGKSRERREAGDTQSLGAGMMVTLMFSMP
jgi:hypothetical protein